MLGDSQPCLVILRQEMRKSIIIHLERRMNDEETDIRILGNCSSSNTVPAVLAKEGDNGMQRGRVR